MLQSTSIHALPQVAVKPSSSPLVSIVAPAYNEASNIQHFIKAVNQEARHLAYDIEVLIVDDGSADDTSLQVLTSPYPARLIRLSRNFGKENALTAGIENAKGNAVILMDSDMQHPVHMIHEFIKAWENGNDMVYGVRIDRQDRSVIVKGASNFFYKLLEKSTATNIPRGAGDFRLLDRKVVDAICSLPERNRFMKGIFGWVGFKTHAIKFSPPERHSGTSSFNLKALINLAVTGVTSFSVLPLRLWTLVGVVVSSLSILYGLFIGLKTMLLGAEVPGWATITVSVLFLGGIQLISIGIIGEYIGRVFEEVKQRPKYIIKDDISNESARDIHAFPSFYR